MTEGERWVQFPGRSRVLHLVHEESTSWSQSESPGSIIAWCGRTSNQSDLTDPPVATNYCKMCQRVRGWTVT